MVLLERLKAHESVPEHTDLQKGYNHIVQHLP